MEVPAPATDEPERIRQTLEAIPPRSAHVLTLRLVEGLSRDECARLYGIRPEAFDFLLLRAAREYAAEGHARELSGAPPPPPRAFEAEALQAAALAAALDGTASAPAEVAAMAEALRGVAARAPEVRERLLAAERALEASPRHRRETWLRRLAILAIVALTAYFYVRSEEPARFRPRAPTPTLPSRE